MKKAGVTSICIYFISTIAFASLELWRFKILNFRLRYIIILLVVCFIILLWIELRTEILREKVKGKAFVFIFFGALVSYYFTPGYAFRADDYSHIVRSWIICNSISNWELPVWTTRWYCGYPFLQFYGPIYFFVVGMLNLLINDIFWTNKIILGLSHMGSGVLMYYLAKHIIQNEYAAIIAGLVYLITPWHIYQIFDWGRLPVSFIYFLLPLPFLIFEKWTFRERILSQRSLLIPLALAILILTHQGYGFVSLQFFFLYFVIRSITQQEKEVIIGNLIQLSTSVLIGFGLVAFFIIPYFLESALVFDLIKLDTTISYQPHGPELSTLLKWSLYSEGYSGYLGLITLLSSTIGIYSLLKSRDSLGVALLCCIGYSFMLVYGWKLPVYRKIPFVGLMAPSRYQIFLIFFVSLVCGYGYRFTVERLPAVLKRFKSIEYKGFLLCMAFLIIDLGSNVLVRRYNTIEGNRHRVIAYDYLRKRVQLGGKIAGIRSIEFTDENHAFYFARPSITPLQIGTSSPLGGFPQGASNNLPYISEILRNVRNEIKENNFVSDKSLDALYLIDLKYIIIDKKYFDYRIGNFTPVYENEMYRIYEIEHSSPILGSKQLVKRRDEDGFRTKEWFELLDSEKDWDLTKKVRNIILLLGIRRDANVSEILLIDEETRGGGKKYLGKELSLVKLVSQDIKDTKINLKISTDANCFIRLSYSYYPYMRVCVDGNRVDPIRSAMNFVVIPFPAGEHNVCIEYNLSGLRKTLSFISLAFLVGCLLGLRYR